MFVPGTRVSLDSDELVADAVAALQEAPSVEPPKITIRVADIKHKRSGLQAAEVQTKRDVDNRQADLLARHPCRPPK